MNKRTVLAIALSCVAIPSAATPQTVPLVPPAARERNLAGGEVHSYEIELKRGQYLSLEVEQLGIDVVVRVFAPDGALLTEMDGPNGSIGPESVSVIAPVDGRHRVEVISLRGEAPSARYRIRVDVPRLPIPGDLARLRAERARSEGSRLFERATAEALTKAVAIREEALRFWRSADLRRQESIELLGLGETHAWLGDNDQALECFRRALSLAVAEGDAGMRFLALHAIGYAYHFLGEPEKALVPLRESLEAFGRLGIPYAPEYALAHIDYAHACWLLGRYDEALQFDRRALSLARAAADRRHEAWALKNLGQVYGSMGEPRQAFEYLEEALGLARAVGDPHLEGHSLISLGSIDQMLGEDERALECFKQALALRRATGGRQWEASALASIASIHLARGDAPAAEEELEESLALLRRVDDRRGEAQALVSLGEARTALGVSPRARDAWDRATALARESGDRLTEATAEAAIARALESEGRLPDARRHAEKALDLVESVRADVPGDQLRSSFLAGQQEFYRLETRLLLALAREDPGKGYTALAFQSTERAKARALVEALGRLTSGAPRDFPADLRARKRDLDNRIASLQTRLTKAGIADETRRDVNERLVEAEAEYGRFVSDMRRRNPRYAALRYPKPLDVSGTRRLLGPSAALVSYFFCDDEVYAFIVSAQTLSVVRLPVEAHALSERVDNFAELLSRGWDSASVGERLSRDLIEPVRSRLPPGIRRLLVSPEGFLYRLPFEALPAPTGGARASLLVTDYAISYVPSATTLAAVAGRPPTVPPRLDLIAFANPAPLSGIPVSDRQSSDPSRSFYETEGLAMNPLPHTAEEARRIRQYAARGSEIFTGTEASERRVKEEALDRFRILHFATHGLVSARYPDRSALVLASSGADGEDGFLQAREISGLKLDCDAVVLSACQTARGRLLAGEGVQGLARAFLYAGARTVVASLWNVNDRRTADLMSSFYRVLSRGTSKAEALRQAKLELLSRPGSAAPRYWAAFVLIGEGDDPIAVTPARSTGPWIWAAATVLAGVLAFAGIRRWRREPGRRRS